jgi:drug/metabolite transporter (DMT)-like permease
MGFSYAMLACRAAVRTTATFYLVPGTAAVLAWALLGERMSGFAVLGLVVASAGCWPVNAAPMTAASWQRAPARRHVQSTMRCS